MSEKPKIAESKILTIDCRELQPPEPLVKVMEAVNKLKSDQAIKMLHRHEPCSLFQKLEQKDLKYQVQKHDDGSVEILIWDDKE